MNRWQDAIPRYAGAVPSPFAIYRPPIIGMAAMPATVGVLSYQLPDLGACRTLEEIVAGIESMKARLTEIQTEYGVQPLGDEARAEWAAIDERLLKWDEARLEYEGRLERLNVLAAQPANVSGPRRPNAAAPARSRIPENLYDLADYRSRTDSDLAMLDLMREGALKASEGWVYPHPKATVERTAQHIHELLAQPRPEKAIESGFDSGLFARYLLAAGSPVYMRAFTKKLLGKDDSLTAEERAAIAVVGTTTTGGYMVPPQLDPTILLTSDGAVNPLRQIARVEQINVGNVLQLITSAGVTASYGTEAVAVTDGAPTVARPSVTAQKGKVLAKFSIEAEGDVAGLATNLARVIQDAKDVLEAEKFVNGSGTNEPEGVLYGIAATYNVGTTGDGFDLDDLGNITTRLGDRWEPRASWLAHRAVYTEAERLDRAAGGGSANAYRPLAAGAPRELLGYPRYAASAMESDFTTATNRIAVFGDFGQFVILDRIGLSIELIPHMVNGDGNPTGERGLFAYFRNGAVVVIDSAFRVLTVGVVTTAA